MPDTSLTPSPNPAIAPIAPATITTAPSKAVWQGAARAVLAAALVGLGLYILGGFLRALVWAAILALATWPLFRRAERYLPRDKHNILVPALFTAVIALVVIGPLATLVVQLGHEARAVTAWVHEARTNGIPAPDALQRLPIGATALQTWWKENLADPEGASALLGRLDRDMLITRGRSLGAQLLHRGVLFLFALLTLFFLYRDGRAVREQLLTGSRRMFGPSGERVGRQIVASVHGTVDGLVLVGLGVGLVLGIAYAVLGVPHPALLGAATAIGAMIPLGATVALAVAALLLLAAGHTVAAIALFAGGSVVIFAADHFIRPALIGGTTKLPFIWVLLGILGGIETFGLLGLFVGPATMAALILLWREWVGDATTHSDHA